ncbi:hypothetical protein GCM10027037_12180 [Mucilaginibacter koreensis]
MFKRFLMALVWCALGVGTTLAQHSSESSYQKSLRHYQDSLQRLGREMVNNESDVERKNANYAFIRMLVTALKTPHSYDFAFDSLKTISILNSPDRKFRIFSWPVMNQDGSYRFYGAVQMNNNGPLVLHPLEDYSPILKNPEDSVTTNRKWFGAEYYKIIPVYSNRPYYVLLGWKGNNVKSTKKVIEVLSFDNGIPVWGKPVFEGNSKIRSRVIFEYSRQASMLLRYVPEQNLIVFDHIAPPDAKMKGKMEMYGPDLTYDGYRLSNGKWNYVNDLDMRNIALAGEQDIEDPKKQAQRDKAAAAASSRRNH